MAVVDDKQLFVIRRDLSGGMNNRQHGTVIAENQATELINVDISVPGESRKRPGLTLIEDLGNDIITGLYGFEPAGATNLLVATHGTKLETWPGSSTFTERKTDFTNDTDVTLLKGAESGEGDVLFVYIDGNNWFRMNQSFTFQDLGNTSGTGSDSPPLSSVAVVFRNRLWILKDDLLYWSDPFPANYATAFNTPADNYRIPVGEERFLIGLRDLGIIVGGEDSIWAINPSAVPAATDKPEKLIDVGCVAKKTAAQVGDDVLFMAADGVRGLFRTKEDKVQGGASFPLSFPLKEEFESISWPYISLACAVYFDNKYFLSLPVDASTTNNEVWVYFPAFNAWMVVTGWNVSSWAKMKVDGEERLYAGDATDGKVYQAWKGFDDNGTAIDYDEKGRKEDLGQPLVSKTGGEVRIRALSSGDYDLTIQASADDQDWTTLGTINLAGDAPTLPINLPFTLAGTNIVEETFHLDSLGSWRIIRIRIRHNVLNGNDEIKVFERSIVSFGDEYASE